MEQLAELHDRIAEVDPTDCADTEALLSAFRLLAEAESLVARAAAAFAARQGHAAEHPSAAAWLAAKTRLPRNECARLLRLGRACHDLPAAAEAWSRGEISGRHVGLLAAKQADDPGLVGHARRLTYAGFTKAVAYWHQLRHPDDAEDDAQRLRDGRRLHLSQTFEGAWRLDADLDPIGGAIVAETLGSIERELFEAEWAGARARLGHDRITVADLPRTPAQRREDALVEMATRARTAPANGRRPAPLFTVLVDFPTLTGRICELADGTVVAPGSLVPWLDGADVERQVWRAPDRIAVSHTARLFTGATKRAIQARDRTCYADGCDVPAPRCQVDHVVPYALGGRTTLANGRLACGFHNRLRNHHRPP